MRYILWQTIADVDFHLNEVALTAKVLILGEKLEHALFGQHELKIFFCNFSHNSISWVLDQHLFGVRELFGENSCHVTKDRNAI